MYEMKKYSILRSLFHMIQEPIEPIESVSYKPNFKGEYINVFYKTKTKLYSTTFFEINEAEFEEFKIKNLKYIDIFNDYIRKEELEDE